MKIGIISMQRVVNYGSFLQAYSLKNIIENMGNKVEFIDYHVEPPLIVADEDVPKAKSPSTLKRAMRFLWEHRSPRAVKLRRFYRAKMYLTERYNNEFLPLLGVTQERKYLCREDAIVIGSDEVFNCLQTNKDVGYSKELFGKDADCDVLISYAASFGTTTLAGLKEYGIDNEIADMLSEFDDISVRDKNSVEIVTTLAGEEPKYHVDPVFLSDYEGLIPDSVKLKKYMIVYAYGSRISEKEACAINAFAAKKGLKIVTIGETNRFEWEHLILSPFEVLAYFKKADYIVTDTFHGSVFSIKYNKQFATIVRDGNRQKLMDLLARFNLEERRVDDIANLDKILDKKYDHEAVNAKIKAEIESSISYLEKYLGNHSHTDQGD